MPDPRMLLVDEDVCFRYQLVSAVLALEIGGTAKSVAARAVAGSAQLDEAGRPRQVSETGSKHVALARLAAQDCGHCYLDAITTLPHSTWGAISDEPVA